MCELFSPFDFLDVVSSLILENILANHNTQSFRGRDAARTKNKKEYRKHLDLNDAFNVYQMLGFKFTKNQVEL